MPGTTPDQPGWYPDGDGGERWYDGRAWTDHRRGQGSEDTVVVPGTVPADRGTGAPPAPAGWPAAAPDQLQVGGGKGLRIAIAVLAVLVLIAAVVVGGIVLVGGDDDDRDADRGGEESATTSEVASSPTTEPTGTDEESLDLPTIDPDDFPSDLPTNLPDLDDLLPSDLPSGFPSDLPDFPTDPADLESWFTDFLEEMNP